MPTTPTYIVNDQPTDKDALDFTPYVETLADIIQTGNTPLTIGVFGTWGSGKTSLMKMVKNQLPKDFTIAWFDAWKYDKEETLWRAFLLSVLTAVRSTIKEGQPTEDLEYMETMLYRNIEIEKAGGVTIDLAKLGGAVAKGGVQLALSFIPGGAVLSEFVKKVQQLGAEALTDEATDAIQRERTKIQIEQVRFLEQFQVKFRHLVEQHVSNNGKRLVVFVDDLDRCLPEKAIEVLEAIKLFLDAENCIFVLGLDQEVIARGIEMKYKELGAKQDGDGQGHFTIEGVRYLEKIIQLPFIIPPVEPSDMGNFVHGLSDPWPHEECPKIFAEGLGDNPRQIKRTVNTFLMLWKLAQKREAKLKGKVKPIRLAKVVAIQTVYPDLYNLLLKEEPRYLRELEEYYRQEAQEKKVYEDKGELQIVPPTETPPALVPFLSHRGAIAVRRILTLHKPEMPDANFIGLPPDELESYFTLTARTEMPQNVLSNIRRIVIPRLPLYSHVATGTNNETLSLNSEELTRGGEVSEVDETLKVKIEESEHDVYFFDPSLPSFIRGKSYGWLKVHGASMNKASPYNISDGDYVLFCENHDLESCSRKIVVAAMPGMGIEHSSLIVMRLIKISGVIPSNEELSSEVYKFLLHPESTSPSIQKIIEIESGNQLIGEVIAVAKRI